MYLALASPSKVNRTYDESITIIMLGVDDNETI